MPFGAGAPDHAVSVDLRHLRGEASDRAGGGGDPDDVAVAETRDPEEAGVRREAVTAEYAEIRLRGSDGEIELRQRRQASERGQPGLDDRIVAPAGCVPDRVTRFEPVGAGFDDLAHSEDLVHRRLERERREVPRRPLRT